MELTMKKLTLFILFISIIMNNTAQAWNNRSYCGWYNRNCSRGDYRQCVINRCRCYNNCYLTQPGCYYPKKYGYHYCN